MLEFNLSQLGIDLEVKYFDAEALLEKVSTRGEPFDLIRSTAGGPTTQTVPRSSSRSSNGKNLQATGNVNVSYFDDPETNARIEAAASSPATRVARPGPTSTST